MEERQIAKTNCIFEIQTDVQKFGLCDWRLEKMNYKTLALFLLGLVFLMPYGGAQAIELRQTTEIKIGGLFPLTGTLAGGGVERRAAAQMAVDIINENDSLLNGYTLNLLVRDTQTKPDVGKTVAQDVINEGAVGIVGAASSAVSKAVAGVAEQSKVPQISYSSTNPDLSNKTLYPYFLRVVPPDSVQGVAIAKIIKEMGFTQIATLATSDDYGLGGITVVEETAREEGIEILSSQRFDQGAVDVKSQLQAIKDSGAHVIVLNAIVGDAKTVFSQADDVGLVGEDYVWIGTDGPTQEAVFENDDGTVDTEIKDAMQGMIGTAPNRGSGPGYEKFLDIWESCNGKTSDDYTGCGDRTPNTFATFAYDAVYAFAYALDRMIKAGKDYTDGDLLLAELKKSDFVGATGRVTFNEFGDRNALYDILNLQGDSFKVVGSWSETDGMSITGTITWPGGGTETPSFAKVGSAPGFGFYLVLFSLASFATIVHYRRRR